jgi:hypothetical protein
MTLQKNTPVTYGPGVFLFILEHLNTRIVIQMRVNRIKHSELF